MKKKIAVQHREDEMDYAIMKNQHKPIWSAMLLQHISPIDQLISTVAINLPGDNFLQLVVQGTQQWFPTSYDAN